MTPVDNRSASAGVRRWRTVVPRPRTMAVAASAAILFVGLLHLPRAKGLLMKLGGCPFASGQLTPAQMDTARHLALATRRGEAPAPSRPALGFSLDSTSIDDVRRWAERVHVSCEDVRAGFITCASVPSEAVGRPEGEGRIDELGLGFNRRGQLVNVTAMRGHLAPLRASLVSTDISSSLRSSLGRATHSAGSLTAASIAHRSVTLLARKMLIQLCLFQNNRLAWASIPVSARAMISSASMSLRE